MSDAGTAPRNLSGGSPEGRYADIQAGQVDRRNGETVEILIQLTPDYVVYLDQDLNVWWWAHKCSEILTTERGAAISAAAVVEATPIDRLGKSHKRAARLMLGQAVSSALADDVEGAKATVEKAREYIEARNRDLTRTWLVLSSTYAVAAALVAMVAMFFLPTYSVVKLPLGEILACGALGAYLSVLARLTQFQLDASAGWFAHHLEGIVRIVVGMLGAVLVSLAIKSHLLLSVADADQSAYVLLTVCFVAGASERLIPNFIRGFESTIVPSE